MNREIKFRFWLGHTEKMTYAHTLQEISKIIPEFTKDIIPLQWTGLVDRLGKEIYEGDIIISKFTGTAKHEVCYGEYGEDYENPNTTRIGFYAIEDGIEILGFGKDINGTTDSYEVIGNIYEPKNKEA